MYSIITTEFITLCSMITVFVDSKQVAIILSIISAFCATAMVVGAWDLKDAPYLRRIKILYIICVLFNCLQLLTGLLRLRKHIAEEHGPFAFPTTIINIVTQIFLIYGFFVAKKSLGMVSSDSSYELTAL